MEMKAPLCSLNQRRRIDHVRICPYTLHGYFLAVWILLLTRAGYLLSTFLRPEARELALCAANPQKASLF